MTYEQVRKAKYKRIDDRWIGEYGSNTIIIETNMVSVYDTDLRLISQFQINDREFQSSSNSR